MVACAEGCNHGMEVDHGGGVHSWEALLKGKGNLSSEDDEQIIRTTIVVGYVVVLKSED